MVTSAGTAVAATSAATAPAAAGSTAIVTLLSPAILSVESMAVHVGMSDVVRDELLAFTGGTLATSLRTFTTVEPAEVKKIINGMKIPGMS